MSANFKKLSSKITCEVAKKEFGVEWGQKTEIVLYNFVSCNFIRWHSKMGELQKLNIWKIDKTIIDIVLTADHSWSSEPIFESGQIKV